MRSDEGVGVGAPAEGARRLVRLERGPDISLCFFLGHFGCLYAIFAFPSKLGGGRDHEFLMNFAPMNFVMNFEKTSTFPSWGPQI